MRVLMASFLLAFSLVAYAAKPLDRAPDFVMARGTGQFSCGKYIEYQQQGNQLEDQLITQWVWGFIAAYNMRGNFGAQWQRVSHITPPDQPTVVLYLKRYCNENPTKSVLTGTLALIRELGGAVSY